MSRKNVRRNDGHNLHPSGILVARQHVHIGLGDHDTIKPKYLSVYDTMQ